MSVFKWTVFLPRNAWKRRVEGPSRSSIRPDILTFLVANFLHIHKLAKTNALSCSVTSVDCADQAKLYAVESTVCCRVYSVRSKILNFLVFKLKKCHFLFFVSIRIHPLTIKKLSGPFKLNIVKSWRTYKLLSNRSPATGEQQNFRS